MAVEVFWATGSPFSWRVLLTLEIKGVPYESRRLEFRTLKTPEFLAVNPRCRVPALRDGNFMLTECNPARVAA